MKKEKGFFGQSIVNIFVAIIEFILTIAIVGNSFTIVTTAVQGAISIYNKNFDNYYQTFYDEESKEYKLLPSENSITEEYLEKNNVSYSSLVIYEWVSIITTEVLLFCLINICESTRKTLKKVPNNIFEKENLDTIKQVKKYLIIAYLIPVGASLILRCFIRLPMLWDLDMLLEFFAIFAFFDFIRILLEQGIKLKENK